MQWKKVADELPPVDTKLFLFHHGDWYIGSVERPFNKDNKYNPNYYIAYLQYHNHHAPYNCSDVRKQTLTEDYYWCVARSPEENKSS